MLKFQNASVPGYPPYQAAHAPGFLFHDATGYDIEEGQPHPYSTAVVGQNEVYGGVFDPVVLTEITLPDNTKYQFSYNVYGEIDKVVYPTNAFEQYEYESPEVDPTDSMVMAGQPYIQAERRIKKRGVSENGSGTDIVEWHFAHDRWEGVSTVIAPDGTYTKTAKARTIPSSNQNFGYEQLPTGTVLWKKAFSNANALLRREVFEYETTERSFSATTATTCTNGQNSISGSAWRNLRIKKAASLIFESGSTSALAQVTTYGYDATHEMTTGVDQTSAQTHHFTVLDAAAAANILVADIQPGSFAKRTETTFSPNPTYRDTKHILGVPTVVKIMKDAQSTVVSQSEMVYDESGYVASGSTNAMPTSMRTWDSTKGSDPNNPANHLVTRAKFDGWGNRLEAIDAKGFVTTTVYDTNYQTFPVQVISPVPDPTGVHGANGAFTTTTTYDAREPNDPPPLGLVIATTDANGQTTTISYHDPVTGLVDPVLRPRKVTAPNGHQTITEYGLGTDAISRWVKVRTQNDTEKWSEAISKYDGLGRTYLTEKIDSQGNVFSETEYDTMGRVKRSTNPYKSGETKQWTTPEYDDLSRTKKVISPDADDVQIAYGLSTTGVIGTTKSVTDQAGKKRTGIADALGNMIRVMEDPGPNELVTDYVFDALGNLRKTVQGEQSRFFMYDSLGRVLFAKQPEQDANTHPSFNVTDPITGNSSWSVKYSYDNNGNILTTTDALNISITGSYDQFNRLKTRDYSDSTPDVYFYYDGKGLGFSPGSEPANSKGKTTKVASTVSESRNTIFDQMGRLLTSEQRTTADQLAGTQTPYTFGYVYNLSGALIEETYPSGRVVKNTLDADGDLSQVQSRKNLNYGFFAYADSFTYNSSSAVTKMQLGNGKWETTAYNERSQITQIGLGVTSSDQDLLNLEFKYTTTPTSADNNGSMREQKITVPTVGTNPEFTATQTYTYDSLNRIQSAKENINGNPTPAWKQTFSIDRYGNRRFDAANTTTLAGCDASVCNPEINTSDNRLKKDQAGGGVVDYDYDANGALIKDFDGQRFGYDAESHQKEFFSASNQTTTPDATYHYDGEGRRVKKIVGTEVTVFVYDANGQLAAEYSTTVVPVEQAKVSYLTTDHLGSPRIITDQNAAVISRKDFTAFGENVTSSQRVGGPNGNGYDPPNVRQDYTGYQKDNESGLEFAQARYYNTGHGRFTSVDPLTASAAIKNPQSFNRYSYVLNSPYEFTDPLGLMAGGCGADRSSCDGGGAFGSIHIAEAEEAHSRRLSYMITALRATAAANRGGLDSAWSIINSTGDPSSFRIFDQNGTEYENPNNGTVTVSATVNGPSETGQSNQIGVIVNPTQNSTYNVSGVNAQTALASATVKCGKLTGMACTNGKFKYRTKHSKKSKGKVSTTGGTVTATIKVTLPKWTGYANASESERKVWDDGVAHLPKHEEDHVGIFTAGAREIANSIAGSARSSKALRAVELRNFTKAVNSVNARSDELDRRTNFGRSP